MNDMSSANDAGSAGPHDAAVFRTQAHRVRREARAHLAQLRAERLRRRSSGRPAAADTEHGAVAAATPPDSSLGTVDDADISTGLAEPGAEAGPVSAIPAAHAPERPAHSSGSGGAPAMTVSSAASEVVRHALVEAAEQELSAPRPDPTTGDDPLSEPEFEPETETDAFGAEATFDVAVEDEPEPAPDAEPSPETLLEAEPTDVDADSSGDVETNAEAGGQTGAVEEPADAVEELADSDLGALPGAGPGLVWVLQQIGIRSLADLAAADAADLQSRLGLVGELINLDGWITFARDRTSG